MKRRQKRKLERSDSGAPRQADPADDYDEDGEDIDIDTLLLGERKPAEGPISYAKAVQIAFDTATDDNTATQFATVLAEAKHCADEAGQPITIFAQFEVASNGELTFDCPTEYKPNLYFWEVIRIIRNKFNVISYNGKYVLQMTNEEQARELLKRVRAGNFDGCRLQDGRKLRWSGKA